MTLNGVSGDVLLRSETEVGSGSWLRLSYWESWELGQLKRLNEPETRKLYIFFSFGLFGFGPIFLVLVSDNFDGE